MAPTPLVIKQAMALPQLTTSERKIIYELLSCNYNEYLMKNDNVSCCYSAMKAFSITAYCIIAKGFSENISNIDITVDIYDTVQCISLKINTIDSDSIIIDWHSTNKINDLYMLYKTQYCGLSNSSILDLVSADVYRRRILFEG